MKTEKEVMDSESKQKKASELKSIPLELLDDFPNHPFKVRDDKDMLELIESVTERGVLVPAMVRPKENGRYELISGHRRKRASECVGKDTLQCFVKDLDDAEAVIIMVDSNIQRSHIPPSEKAFAYKMKLDAMKKKAGRPKKDNLTPVVSDFKRTNEELAEQVGESRETIRRYIRLTFLVPELLELVDEGRMKMRPAVELSYLDEDCQRDLVDAIDEEDCTPTHAQAIRLRKAFNENALTRDAIFIVMQEEKPNQKDRIILKADTVKALIPNGISENKRLANAVFQIYAAEEIVTLDGTVRAVKGELVDEITTGKDGIAKSKELYLGKYTVIEKTAPDTFVNANEQYDIELTYAGQDIKVTSTALSVFNERQKVSVSLLKELSQDERFKLGMNDEILSVQFGIYANEDIKAADGSVIPADSLIT